MLKIKITVMMQVNSDSLSPNFVIYKLPFLNTAAISVLNYSKYQWGALER